MKEAIKMKLIKVHALDTNKYKAEEYLQAINAEKVSNITCTTEKAGDDTEYFGIEFVSASWITFVKLDSKFKNEEWFMKLINKLADSLEKENIVDFDKLISEL